MKLNRNLLAGLFAAALAVGGLISMATGQVTLPGLQSGMSQADQFLDVVNGVPQAQGQYALGIQISGVQGYEALYGGLDAHGQTITYTATAGVTNIFAYATTSAITSVTITTEAHPGDGQRECYMGVGEATTTLAFTANTGQSLQTGASGISAGVSNVGICITYVKSLAEWFRSN